MLATTLYQLTLDGIQQAADGLGRLVTPVHHHLAQALPLPLPLRSFPSPP